jgi:hypothetical protein
VSLVLAALLAAGCDPLVVEFGEGNIAPVVIERVMFTGLEPEDGCPSISVPYITFDGRDGDASVEPSGAGCALSFREEAVPLVPADVMERLGAELAGFDRSALLGADLVVNELRLFDGVREPIALAQLEAMTLSLDGEPVFTADELADAVAAEARGETSTASGTRIPVPQEMLDRFLEALDGGEPFSAELAVELVFREGVTVPTLMLARAELQPVLRVDAWKVVF